MQRLAQRDDRVLRHVVDAHAGRRDQARDRGGVHDVAFVALPQQDRGEDAHAVDDAPEVHAERPAPVGSVASHTTPSGATPALLHTTCTAPNASSAARASRSTDSPCETSVGCAATANALRAAVRPPCARARPRRGRRAASLAPCAPKRAGERAPEARRCSGDHCDAAGEGLHLRREYSRRAAHAGARLPSPAGPFREPRGGRHEQRAGRVRRHRQHGWPMAKRFLGGRLRAHGVRRRSRAGRALRGGDRGAGAESGAALAGAADIVITMLPTGAVVRDALLGAGGIARSLARGAIVVDMSSSDPNGTRSSASELAERGDRASSMRRCRAACREAERWHARHHDRRRDRRRSSARGRCWRRWGEAFPYGPAGLRPRDEGAQQLRRWRRRSPPRARRSSSVSASGWSSGSWSRC